MTQEEEIAQLRAENHALQEQLRTALARIAELEGQKVLPSFVKANTAKHREKRAKKARKNRQAEENGVRRREEPTQIVEHRLETCPDCRGRLSALMLARRRQVIELPAPPRLEVIEHQIYKGWCSYCHQWKQAGVDLGGQVLGQSRLSSGIASLIAYLRTILRLPIRQIQQYLRTLHGLTLSVGEVVEVLHHVERVTRPALKALQAEVRSSAVVHMDETGWREDGRNGYIWSASTPHGVRYYEYHHSRAGPIVETLLGPSFKGVLISDFYGAYNDYACPHQRCWVHLLRDLHDLKKEQAQEPSVVQWAQEIKGIFAHAQESKQRGTGSQDYAGLVAQAKAVAARYAQQKKHPCQALAKRLLRHQDELFQFVLRPEVAADNNLAERSIRPLVVLRKISGGSRSPQGSQTGMALASLFGTWQAKGLDALEQCRLLLSQQTPLPQP